jgi:hypothetical protein
VPQQSAAKTRKAKHEPECAERCQELASVAASSLPSTDIVQGKLKCRSVDVTLRPSSRLMLPHLIR